MHLPVLQKEVINYLNPGPNENFIDCTLGEAGHSLAILEKNSPEGKILGIDRDPDILENTRQKIQKTKYKNRLILVRENFVNLKEIVEKYNFRPINGILFDLGMSSWHLEESGRGFSFQKEEPLDMRFDKNSDLTAEKILNEYPEEKIERILREYGEEKFSRQIAKKIVEFRKLRPLKTISQLVEILKKSVPIWYQYPRTSPDSRVGTVRGKQKINLATRTFQALRIAVNNELDNLERVLPQTLEMLESKGRLVIISFPSLEDRIVKNFLSASAKGYGGQKGKIKLLTKKPIKASLEEIRNNPRSRSAKLRVAIKI